MIVQQNEYQWDCDRCRKTEGGGKGGWEQGKGRSGALLGLIGRYKWHAVLLSKWRLIPSPLLAYRQLKNPLNIRHLACILNFISEYLYLKAFWVPQTQREGLEYQVDERGEEGVNVDKGGDEGRVNLQGEMHSCWCAKSLALKCLAGVYHQHQGCTRVNIIRGTLGLILTGVN